MNWSEIGKLLKPAPGKVVLFAVLFIIFVPVAEYDNGILCVQGGPGITGQCNSSASGSVAMYLLRSGTIFQFYYAAALVGAVATYLIACLLVSLYKSVRK